MHCHVADFMLGEIFVNANRKPRIQNLVLGFTLVKEDYFSEKSSIEKSVFSM